MASFVATLKFDGNEFDVLSTAFVITQLTDDKNRAASPVTIGDIVVSLIADDTSALFQWAADPYKQNDGSISFNKLDEASTLKELKFEKGLCNSYSESFTANSPDSMIVNITISPEKITLYDATVDMTVKK